MHSTPCTINSGRPCYYAPASNRRGIKRCLFLTSVCQSRTSGLSREQRPRKTKIGAEVAHVTRDSDTTFEVKRSKVIRPLYSPPCWRIRQLQPWAWERVGREKLLLRCRLLGRARRFSAHGERRGAGAKKNRKIQQQRRYDDFQGAGPPTPSGSTTPVMHVSGQVQRGKSPAGEATT